MTLHSEMWKQTSHSFQRASVHGWLWFELLNDSRNSTCFDGWEAHVQNEAAIIEGNSTGDFWFVVVVAALEETITKEQ